MGIPCSAVGNVTTSLEDNQNIVLVSFHSDWNKPKGLWSPVLHWPQPSLLALPLRCSTCSPGSTAQ